MAAAGKICCGQRGRGAHDGSKRYSVTVQQPCALVVTCLQPRPDAMLLSAAAVGGCGTRMVAEMQAAPAASPPHIHQGFISNDLLSPLACPSDTRLLATAASWSLFDLQISVVAVERRIPVARVSYTYLGVLRLLRRRVAHRPRAHRRQHREHQQWDDGHVGGATHQGQQGLREKQRCVGKG